MTLRASRSVLAATVVIAVAVGCAGLPGTGTYKKSTGAATATPIDESKSSGGTHPIAAFLAAARAGDSTHLTLPETGTRVRVTAQRMYFAASGRYCRRYEVTHTNSPTTSTQGLACKNGRQDWELQNLIVNPNDVNAPQRSLLPK